MLAEKGIFHSDIKENNVVIKTIISDSMNISLIDLGGAVLDSNDLDTYTKSYFFYDEKDF